jgi:hypothetical protein
VGDGGYYDALDRMFGQALEPARALQEDRRAALRLRLARVRDVSPNFGYGVGG